jgi:hypothetical protein
MTVIVVYVNRSSRKQIESVTKALAGLWELHDLDSLVRYTTYIPILNYHLCLCSQFS